MHRPHTPTVYAARDGFACHSGLDDRPPVLHYYIFMSIYDAHIYSTLLKRTTWFQRHGQENKNTSSDYKIAGRI